MAYKYRIKYGDTTLVENLDLSSTWTKTLDVSNQYLNSNIVLESYSRLPSGYTEVQYISASGSQYINTNIIPSNNTKVEGKLSGWTQSGSHQIFGARYNWSSSGRGFAIVTDAYQFNGNATVSHGLTDGSTHTFAFSQAGLYTDGVLKVTPSTATFTSPVVLYLFALNENGSLAETTVCSMYYFKIYTSGTLVRDFVPCKNSSSVAGMYDLVSDTFFGNSGSGSFTAGPEVTTGLNII